MLENDGCDVVRGTGADVTAGEILLLLSQGVCSLCDEGGLRIGEASLVKLIRKH